MHASFFLQRQLYPTITGLVRGNPLGKYTSRCIRECTQFRSIADLRNAMVLMMEQLPETRSKLENGSRNFGLSTLPSCETVTHTLLESIARMTPVLVPNPFPSRQKRREPRKQRTASYGTLLLWNAVSPMSAKRQAFVFRMQWTIRSDK